ncbi:hypothetical protein D9M70_181950 [compost metagenome]
MQSVTHAGRCRTLVQLLVDGIQLPVGGAHQALDLGGDFRFQVVFKDFAFARGQQFAPLRDVIGKMGCQGIGTLRAVLIDDVNSKPPVVGLRGGVMTQGACQPLKLGQLLGDDPLYAIPVGSVVRNALKRLLGASCDLQCGIDGPGADAMGQREVRECRRQQTALGKSLQALDRLRACRGALRQGFLGSLRHGPGDGARFAGARAFVLLPVQVQVSQVDDASRFAQIPAQCFHRCADCGLQDLEASFRRLGALVGRGEFVLPLGEQCAGLVGAFLLLKMARPRIAPLPGRLEQCMNGFCVAIHSGRDAGKVLQCGGKLKIHRVVLQLLPRLEVVALRFPALRLCLRETPLSALKLAPRANGGQACPVERGIGRRALQFGFCPDARFRQQR